MPTFGKRSIAELEHMHPDLRAVFEDAIKHIDFTVICGRRGRAAQQAAFAAGNSKAKFGQSPHNFVVALAGDVVPFPFNGYDEPGVEKRFIAIAEQMKASAARLGIKITWGGDFKSIRDIPHFELTDWRTLKGALAE